MPPGRGATRIGSLGSRAASSGASVADAIDPRGGRMTRMSTTRGRPSRRAHPCDPGRAAERAGTCEAPDDGPGRAGLLHPCGHPPAGGFFRGGGVRGLGVLGREPGSAADRGRFRVQRPTVRGAWLIILPGRGATRIGSLGSRAAWSGASVPAAIDPPGGNGFHGGARPEAIFRAVLIRVHPAVQREAQEGRRHRTTSRPHGASPSAWPPARGGGNHAQTQASPGKAANPRGS